MITHWVRHTNICAVRSLYVPTYISEEDEHDKNNYVILPGVVTYTPCGSTRFREKSSSEKRR